MGTDKILFRPVPEHRNGAQVLYVIDCTTLRDCIGALSSIFSESNVCWSIVNNLVSLNFSLLFASVVNVFSELTANLERGVLNFYQKIQTETGM